LKFFYNARGLGISGCTYLFNYFNYWIDLFKYFEIVHACTLVFRLWFSGVINIYQTKALSMKQKILSLEDLITYLSSLHPLSLPEVIKDRLRKIVKVKTIKKREHLLSAGEVCRHVYFIKRGILRCYFYNEDDEEVTGWIFGEKKTVVGVMSFYTQQPGFEYIHALKDTEVFYISYEELIAIYLEFPEFCFVALLLAIEYLMFWFLKLCNLRRLDAKQRFDQIMNSEEATLFNLVPLKYLASYINVAPETLSRLRRNS